MHFCEKSCIKSNNFPNFTRHLPEKCPNFTLFARKIFSGIFFFLGGGQPLAPVSYSYGWAPGHPPVKSGPGRQSPEAERGEDADRLARYTSAAEQSNGPSLDSSQRHCRVFNHCQGHRRRDGQSAHHGRSHSCTQPIVLLPHPAVDLRVTWVKLGLRSQLDLSPKRLESRLCNQLDLKFS